MSETKPQTIERACGCVVTTEPGHTHTKMCKQHSAEYFGGAGPVQWPPHFEDVNLDLIGG